MRLMKKAEMTSKMIVTIVLLIAGFAILLIVYSQLNWTGQVDKSVCHQSVIIRATLPSIAQDYIPLKCKTDKLCVTSGFFGGKCEDAFYNAKGVTKVKVKNKEQIEKLISQEIVDCWGMMGEGKVSLFSQYLAQTYGVEGVYPTCVICSRIAFDDKLDQSIGEEGLIKIDPLTYMMTHRVPNKEVSYYEYLAGKSPIALSSQTFTIPTGVDSSGEPEETVVLEKSEVEKEKIDEIAVLFMQISAPTVEDTWINIGQSALGVGAATFVTAPTLTVKAATMAGKLCVSSIPGAIICTAIAVVAGGAQIANVKHNQAITAGYCGDISLGDDARSGCSVVRTVSYNEEEIRKYCSVIESIP